ncbi:MAG: putative phiE125 gp8 family phage protein [Lentimonas sp.]|jgi:uncharacterized phiE125 gp8 family phage protein
MRITRSVEAVEQPIQLAELKTYLCLQDLAEHENEYLLSLVQLASRAVEDMSGCTLLDTVFCLEVADWQSTYVLPDGNFREIQSVEYQDAQGVSCELGRECFYLSTNAAGRLQLVLTPSFSRPALHPEIRSIRIAMVAGYSRYAVDLPESFVNAIRILVADLYRQRVVVQSELRASIDAITPLTARALCQCWKHVQR